MNRINGIEWIRSECSIDTTPFPTNPSQGLSILRSLRELTAAYVKLTAEMADPEKAGGLFEAYAAKMKSDPAYTALLARIEGGDRAAANELQQRVADEAWGGSKC